MLARARAVPMIVGIAEELTHGEEVLVDAAAGRIIAGPQSSERHAFRQRAEAERRVAAEVEAFALKPAVTKDGVSIAVHLNIASPEDLDGLDPALCDGIGLVRTELLFEGSALPDEETQYRAYRHIAEWAKGRPVTIRTLDAGGDKPIPGLTAEGESNPFLGLRGVRLTLRHADLFRTQLRALCRAALHGSVEIMIPMVAVPREFEAVRVLLEEAAASLAREGIAHRKPPLGMMVEVPSAAIAPDLYAADFYSIGSNDLTQYVMAAGRDIEAVADLARADDPAVLRLIAGVARHGLASGRKVSLCGDAGGDPAIIPALIGAGLRNLSMSPRLVPQAKAAIACLRAEGG
jgi:phosphoenolpyruvate-protein phosphotransferase (PTS system enzyme I)